MKTEPKNLFAALALLLAFMPVSNTARADTIYVANGPHQRVDKFTASGTGTLFAGINANNAYGLATDSVGNLYVVNSYGYNTIEKFSPAGTHLASIVSTNTYFLSPIGIVFDKSGNFYVACAGGAIIEKFSPSGTDLGVFAATEPGSQPNPLAIDSAGNIYAGNNVTYDIQKFTPAGAGSLFASLGTEPGGLAIDSSNNVYVSYVTRNLIEKFSAAGTDLGVFANTNLTNPQGLAIDSAGNIYAANSDWTVGNGTIAKFTPAGIGTIYASGLLYPTEIGIAPDPFNASIKLFAGIILNNGQIGSNYLIQATANLSTSNWTTLTNVTLPSNPYIYIDYSSYTNSQQFYRAVPQ